MSSFLESKVRFDDSSIEKIFSDPGLILGDIQSFWENEEPYKITKGWHESNQTPIDYEGFESCIREIEGLDPEKRRQYPVLRFRDMVMEQASVFHRKALPHLCSYLPDNTPPIEVSVCFVAYITPLAFARQGKIIMNLAHSKWENRDVGLLLNILVHELYHGGFHQHQENVDADPSMSKDELLEHIMWWLQNEGIATYVSYKARHLFPIKEDVPDYRMLENMPDVVRLSEDVNRILTRYDKEPYKKVINMIWGKGVQERAFYVVGAYMSKKIEEEKGRGALIETIGKGARYFIETYNDLAFNDFKIIL